jgi:hypothetical protein
VRPWDSLTDDERRLFARVAEVYAGFVSYTDAQIGRLIDYLEESGQLDNTIVVVVSDNGASGEGGPNQPLLHRLGVGVRHAVSVLEALRRLRGRAGGRLRRRVAERHRRAGEVRHQYVHAVDIVPTIYDVLGVDAPDVIKGCTQSPIEGETFAASFTSPDAPGRETQFYSMLGMRGLYHQGWLVTAVPPPLSGWSHFDHDVWELYDLRNDRTQLHDLAAEQPERLEDLKGLWFYYAGIYKGLPLDDRTAREILGSPRPQPSEPRERYMVATSEIMTRSCAGWARRRGSGAAGLAHGEPKGRACPVTEPSERTPSVGAPRPPRASSARRNTSSARRSWWRCGSPSTRSPSGTRIRSSCQPRVLHAGRLRGAADPARADASDRARQGRHRHARGAPRGDPASHAAARGGDQARDRRAQGAAPADRGAHARDPRAPGRRSAVTSPRSQGWGTD